MSEQATPLVSVIVPVFNTERYLRECLDSICNQSYRNLEILVINDCSSDESQIIIDEFAKRDPRIIALKTATNSGQSRARNIGLQKATGKYLIFVDSDDSISSNNVEALEKAITKNNCDLVISPLYLFNELKGEYFSDSYYSNSALTEFEDQDAFPTTALFQHISETNVGPCGKMFNLKSVRSKNVTFPEGIAFEDNVFFWDLVANHDLSFCAISQPLYFYKAVREGNVTTSKKGFTDIFKALDALDVVFKKHGVQKKISPEILRYKLGSFVVWQRGRDNSKLSLSYFRQARSFFKKVSPEDLSGASIFDKLKVSMITHSPALAYFAYALLGSSRDRQGRSQ